MAARLPASAGAPDVEDALDLALGRRVATAPRRAPLPQAPADDARLGRQGLESVFEAVSRGVQDAGAADRDFLARLALLLAEEVGDPARVLALVASAAGPQAAPAPRPGVATAA